MISPFSNKIISYYESAQKIKRKEMPVPRMVLFCPSASCNLKCYYCIYAQERDKGNIMPEEKAFDVINQLSDFGVEAIDMCGGGDPLVAPYIDKLFFHINQLKMKFGVITNGVALRGDVMKNIVQFGSYLRVSIDSIVPETYKKMKGIDKSKAVMENLEEVIKYKDKTQSNIWLSAKIGLSKENSDLKSTVKTIAYLKKLKLHDIQIRCLRDIPDELPKEALSGLANLFIQYDLAYSKESNPDFPSRNVFINLEKTSIDKKCWLTPIHSVIMSDGNVYLCCYYTNRQAKHCIGNINNNSFKDIWFSTRHWEAINEINPKECNHYDCKFHLHCLKMEDFINNKLPEFI